MLSKLVRYKNRNDIMVDLDKDTNEAEALMDIFDELWEFDYDPITRHCFQVRNIPKVGSWDREERTIRNIKFVIWTSSTNKD